MKAEFFTQKLPFVNVFLRTRKKNLLVRESLCPNPNCINFADFCIREGFNV